MEGSKFVTPIPGVTIGCMSEEARDLMDEALAEYCKHKRCTQDELSSGDTTKPSVYSFAYWLFRWSGLVQRNTP